MKLLSNKVFRVLIARHRARKRRDRQSGVALLLTISTLTLLIAMISNFTYDTSVQMAQTANARDEVRAHYMARSAVNLSRLLVKIQIAFIEPIMAQAAQLLNSSLGAGMGISLRVTDYAGPILGFFSGSKGESAALGTLIGIDVTQAKGLGMKAGSIDAEIVAEDGKIDINCGSGLAATPGNPGQKVLFRELSSMFFSPRYRQFFEVPNADGQIIDRLELSRAIIDWADGDDQKFDPLGAGAGSEDYRYDQRRDRYRAHNNSYDTMEEVAMTYGMSSDVLAAFSPFLTVYANGDRTRSCKVNLRSIKGACTPLLVGLIRAAAQPNPLLPPKDVNVFDDRILFPLASILCERGSIMGFEDIGVVAGVLANPAQSISREDPRYEMMQSLRGLNITRADLETVAFTGPPRVYRITATGSVGKVTKRITAVLDTQRDLFNPLTQNVVAERAAGVLQFWREE